VGRGATDPVCFLSNISGSKDFSDKCDPEQN
jgi:hypothetical protein